MSKQGKTRNKVKMATTADRHFLYQEAVQNVESEIDFVTETFKTVRGRDAHILREDFCGTMNTSCEWVRRHEANKAICVDIDAEVLDWGRQHNIAKLSPEQQGRLQVIQGDVFEVQTTPADIILAMNFSYFTFKLRSQLREYFSRVRQALTDDGLFMLDFFGGYEAFQELEETRECEGFDYVWDQDDYDPISGHIRCYIHFEFPDRSRMERAFTYEWRLWTLPEIQEILVEAGFGKVTAYLEGDDGDSGEGDGVFAPAARSDADAGILAYIVAEK